jgi:hypothetical protein
MQQHSQANALSLHAQGHLPDVERPLVSTNVRYLTAFAIRKIKNEHRPVIHELPWLFFYRLNNQGYKFAPEAGFAWERTKYHSSLSQLNDLISNTLFHGIFRRAYPLSGAMPDRKPQNFPLPEQTGRA